MSNKSNNQPIMNSVFVNFCSNIYALSIILILLLANDELMAQEWEKLPDLLRPRSEHANFVYNGNIYIIGGIHDHVYGPYNIEVFDIAKQKWKDIGIWRDHRHHFKAGSSIVNNELWVCGGKPGAQNTGMKSVMVYHIDSNTWRNGPDLPRVVWGAPAVILNESLHVVGGAESNHSTLNNHFVLDLKDNSAQWKSAKSIPRPVVHAAGVAFKDELWVIGGEIDHAHSGDKAWVQIYNPESDSWREGPSLPIARSHLEWSTFVADGKIWSVNGVNSSKPDGVRGQDEIFIYDPSKSNWEIWGKLPHNFTSVGAKIVDGYLYVFGGGKNDWFDGNLSECWRTPISNDKSF